MQQPRSLQKHLRSIITAGLALALLVGCGAEETVQQDNDRARLLAGDWILRNRIVDNKTAPVTQRHMRLLLKPGATFTIQVKGDAGRPWITAASGGFSYLPPHLTLFRDYGPVVRLTVVQAEKNRLHIHHGRNLVPLADQEPDEIFHREDSAKKKTKSAS